MPEIGRQAVGFVLAPAPMPMAVVSSARGRKAVVIPGWMRLLGWLATALMTAAVVMFLWSSVA